MFYILLVNIFTMFSLVKQSDRPTIYNYVPTCVNLNVSESDLLDYSIKCTADILKFCKRNNISNVEANCVGYSQVCANIFNKIAKTNGYDCYAKPVVGYVKLFNVNLCKSISSLANSKTFYNFTKDHDFVEFYINGQIIYADPCVYDILGDKCKTVK